jgi:hypothetical protein
MTRKSERRQPDSLLYHKQARRCPLTGYAFKGRAERSVWGYDRDAEERELKEAVEEWFDDYEHGEA